MLILALDTSQLQAVACLIEDGRIVASDSGGMAVSHSEALLPILDRLLKTASVPFEKIDVFAAGVGPGSFTGLRIGCATVKGFGQAGGKPVLPFSSLRALACSAEATSAAHVVSMINAYQGQVFAGWDSGTGFTENALSASKWCERNLAAYPQGDLVFCGTGAKVYWDAIREGARGAGVAEARLQLKADVLFATAQGVTFAINQELKLKGKQGALISYSQLQAHYLRPSEAEIKLGSRVADSKYA